MNNTVHNIACVFALGLSALAAVAQTGHVDPPGWWGDLEEGKVEVLVSHPDLGVPRDVDTDNDEVTLLSWRPSTLPGHVWIELDVSGVQEATEVALNVLPERGRWTSFPFQVVPARPSNRLDRWEEAPAMYLIMPDRFANGDPSNDDVKGQLERGIDRTEMYARHGGDLAGVESKLDYLEELGVGAVWMTPVVANDLAKTSYHGYACTDSYLVDPRLGTLKAYKSLAAAAHDRGIRIVHDWVPNHWGNIHRLLTHPVDSAWVHNWKGGFTDDKRTNYRSGVVLDPHGQSPDVAGFNDGWFDRMMPDMNQANEDLQRYMGTNILWWMAEVGIDGLRIDTYTYGQQDAMAAMTKRVSESFPDCFMFAEAWVYGSAKQAALVEGNGFGWGPTTGLDGAVDFAWHFAMQEAMEQGEGWEHGIGKVYEVLVEDFLYPDPQKLVTFLDNHDTHRWIAEAGDADKAKAGLAMLLMGRGTPCLYYGTELGFDTRCEPDGKVRQDFPGGWPEDGRNAFAAEGRTVEESVWFDHVHGLLNIRKAFPRAFQGGLEHFFPKRGVYGFSREQDDVRIVTLVNAANDTRPLPWDNVGPWVQDAVAMEQLQPDGTLAADVLTPEDTLGAWSHQVWVIRR
ncbi:MAG: alpha-amylase family glycosyl hydrolase [Bacteroidota bacterium]|nr:alpha-amylase family glycosyl hydrolase [Bacteroidota bacterium]